jgi:hypothetical protein
MALPLESKIMADIGLGMHYSWYNGSGSCRHIALGAAQKLPEVLKAEGVKIDRQLVRLLEKVADHETRYELTKTWVCASDVIQLMIHRTNGMSKEMYDEVKENIIASSTPKGSPYMIKPDGTKVPFSVRIP